MKIIYVSVEFSNQYILIMYFLINSKSVFLIERCLIYSVTNPNTTKNSKQSRHRCHLKYRICYSSPHSYSLISYDGLSRKLEAYKSSFAIDGFL